MRGRCKSIVKRIVRSTRVPIDELPRPRIRSPFQCPGTALYTDFGTPDRRYFRNSNGSIVSAHLRIGRLHLVERLINAFGCADLAA